LKKPVAKITLFILIAFITVACNSTKRVPEDKNLLNKVQFSIDGSNSKDEALTDQLYQKPNSTFLGYRLRLALYNLAKQKSDSAYNAWLEKKPARKKTLIALLSKKQVNRLGESFVVSGFNNFLMRTGEPPVIYDSVSTKKSLKRLKFYYYNRGYFDVKTSYETDSVKKQKLDLAYKINLGAAFIVDSLSASIETPALDSLFQIKQSNAIIVSGKQYATQDIEDEKKRITEHFRNNGVYSFQSNYIFFNLDTINTNKKLHIEMVIKNENIRATDSTFTRPFKIYKISKVSIFTDNVDSEDRSNFKDSVTYKGFKLYSKGKLKYRPKAITDAIFITPNSFYSDNRNSLTSRFLSNLKVFNYPSIQYKIDPNDDDYLIANIYLSPRKKYTFNAAIDFTHSNIQDFGISGNTSVGVRNVFNGAETFELGFRGNIGSSRQLDNPNNNFFNISEFGVDAKLNFPRIFLPFNTEKIIPKTMIPYTTLSVGLAKQTNIGLDKQNFTSSLSYNWTPKRGQNIRFDILNIQFVKNVNIRNYYSIYQSSYNALNNFAIAYNANPNYFDSNNNLLIDSGTIGFTNDVLGNNPTVTPTVDDLKSIRSIEERRIRLTENNLIFATSINFFKTTNVGLKDNNFYSVRAKVESAGNILSLFANASKALKNQNGATTIFDVEYSQYFKTELEYIKHWDFKSQRIVAIRAFGGIAIPYGNSNSIPFSRSYFSGGSNDNRAWQPYSLGPGSSGGINDFNEANLKLGFSAELRFNLFGKLNGAIFSDVGNIWNVLDNVNNEASTFNGFKSLKDIAVGTGLGLRYDFGLFVVRGDLGFKTYNPAKIQSERWFKELNFSKSVINIGINYPF
jgi:outer membrane protein assembly factor BamA